MSFDLEKFVCFKEGLEKYCFGMIIQFFIGGCFGVGKICGGMLLLKLDMVFLLVGLNNFFIWVYENLLDLVDWFVEEMCIYGVKLEIEVFDFSYILQVVVMNKDGWILGNIYIQFVMGVKNVMFVDKDVFDFYVKMVECLMLEVEWCVVGIGVKQLIFNEWLIVVGGYVCMGFEDNICFDKDNFVFFNVVLVKCIVEICVVNNWLVVMLFQVWEIFGFL